MRPTLTHVALHVADLEACVAFYQRYCGLVLAHERGDDDDGHVAWLSEEGKQDQFVMVLIGGGPRRPAPEGDYSHLGFAVQDEAQVDALAERARREGCLLWSPRREPHPVGYYCGILDPSGNVLEFSYGQPLGPGARD